MPKAWLPFWKDLNLFERYRDTKGLLSKVFNMTQKTEHVFWKSVRERIEGRKLNVAESKRLAEAEAVPHWKEDCDRIRAGRLPAVVAELGQRVERDYHNRVQKMVDERIKNLVAEHAKLTPNEEQREWVHIRTSTGLVWLLHKEVESVIEQIRSGKDLCQHLDKRAVELIEFFTNPDPLFRDYEHLEVVGRAMWDYLRGDLGLKTSPQATTRERIREARKKKALLLRGPAEDGSARIAEKEIGQIMPWPESFDRMVSRLRDEGRTEAPSFSSQGKAFIHQRLESQRKKGLLDLVDQSFGQYKAGIYEELVDMTAFRIAKNGLEWEAEDRSESAWSWAIRVISGIREEVRRAQRYYEGERARINPEAPNEEDLGNAPAIGANPENPRARELRESYMLLPDLERKVLCWRKGFDPVTSHPMPNGVRSAEEVGEELGLSVPEVREVLEAAIEQLGRLLGGEE